MHANMMKSHGCTTIFIIIIIIIIRFIVTSWPHTVSAEVNEKETYLLSVSGLPCTMAQQSI